MRAAENVNGRGPQGRELGLQASCGELALLVSRGSALRSWSNQKIDNLFGQDTIQCRLLDFGTVILAASDTDTVLAFYRRQDR